MLEVKNLRKEYKSKNGVVTKALDDVSLNFPETGMVFILGKSGSGKSTLLNVCGGLDKADSGEIIIKGKSSNEFTGQDFDSYRNTFVGFVFQEYNILDEFSVEENIALALELQNKKRDKEVISKILADVDMTDFASRKPNTLSGGQKQRVAIARALVKEPEIIMADEPTGALDSKTGQQVFDTLKKLSQHKLVLVISHDRDFAEQYGDRIIELKDGKILSDQTRVADDGEAKNIRFFGTDTVCVANGSEVTDEDLQNIKKFLKRSGGAAVISTSREHIANIKESRPEINVGSFENIKAQPVSKSYEEQKLIRSHLPMRHAIRMGANSLKTKPVRLVFTIFLSIVAFIMFGLASTLMLFDGNKVTVQTFVDAGDRYLIFSKGYFGKYTSYIDDEIVYQDKEAYKRTTLYTVDEYKKIAEKYNGALAVAEINGRIDSIRLGQYGSQYYSEYIKQAILVNDDIEIINGRRPAAADEIAVSDYIYNAIALPKTKFTDSYGTERTISEPEDLLYSETNKLTLRISDNEYKVVGIFKLDTPSSEFDDLEKAAREDRPFAGSELVPVKWDMYFESCLLPSVMATEELIQKFGSSDKYIYGSDYFYYTQGDLKIWHSDEDNWSSLVYYVGKYNEAHKFPLFDLYGFSGNKVTALPANSVALSAYKAGALYAEAYYKYINDVENSNEEREKINAEVSAAEEAFAKEHLLVDKYFDAEHFNADKQYWQHELQAARSKAEENGVEFDEEEFRLAFPEPQKTDRYDEYSANSTNYKYYNGDDEYYNAFYEYSYNCRETAGTFKAYKTLIYEAKQAARASFIANNPEPVYPGDNASAEQLNAYQNAYTQWSDKLWSVQNEAENNAGPLNKLRNAEYFNLSKQEILDLFEQVRELFPDCKVEIGIKNDYNDFKNVTLAGMFFEKISDSCAYLSDDIYAKYYVSDSYGSYRYEYVTKYKAPENAIINLVYIPYVHDNSAVQELVNLTYARGEDDSTAIIQNSQMGQLEMFIELADTLGTAFLISGLALALFAFLLMFNFISTSITVKKKEIGILRAIGARTLDVYKIFVSESMIIALICFVVSVIGSFGLCLLMNDIITSGTFINISIFAFGPLSVLFILGVALLTALISTVIPVAIYSRKPPIASIRTL